MKGDGGMMYDVRKAGERRAKGGRKSERGTERMGYPGFYGGREGFGGLFMMR